MHGRNVLAGLLLLSIVSGGCVIPQDEQVIPPLPPKRNGPLKIVSHNPPELRLTYYNSTTTCHDPDAKNPSFSLHVEDEDQGDLIDSLWFIDKSNDGSSRPYPTRPGAKRKVEAPMDTFFYTQLANLRTDTHHLLTVYVADSPFQEVVGGVVSVSREPRLLPDGSTMVDNGSIDTITWVLDIEPCP